MTIIGECQVARKSKLNTIFTPKEFQKQRSTKLADVTLTFKNKDQYLKGLDQARFLFSNEGLTFLALEGVKILAGRAEDRLRVSPGPGALLHKEKDGPVQTARGGRLEVLLGEIAGKMKVAKTIGPGIAGFASVALMDTIKIDDQRSALTAAPSRGETDASQASTDLSLKPASLAVGFSKFNLAWQIAEFGTGMFAFPDRKKRTYEDSPSTKVDDPKLAGAWYLNPRTKSIIILGQEGAHFLFGNRKTTDEVRKDIDIVIVLLAKIVIAQILEASGGVL